MLTDVDRDLPTRERLLTAAMRLFAMQGFEATSTREIEEAVGLKPNRGGLYKHFASKEALLHEAVERHVAHARAFVGEALELDADELRRLSDAELWALAESFGQWFLAELDAHRHLTHAFEHDPERLRGLAEDFRRDVVDFGYRTAATLLEAIADPADDHEAAAVLLLGSLSALRRNAWTFGHPALGMSDERALREWVRQAVGYRAGPAHAGSDRER
jgi:AcrR family transcriptional regulator